MEKFFKNKKNAIFISLIAMLLWGSAIPLIKSTYAVLDVARDDTGMKILIAGMRFFLAGVITTIYFKIFNKEKVDVKKINIKFIIILGFIQTTVQYLFYYIGLSNTEGVKAAIIQASNAFFVVILSAVLIKSEKINKKIILSLLLGTMGILIVNYKPGSSFSFTINGEMAILIATICNAMGTVLVRKYGREENPFVLNATQFIIGAIPLLIIGILTKKNPLELNITAVLMLLYGGFISATSFTLWTIVLKYHSSGEFGIYKLFIPIFGSLLSIIILGEKFTINLLIGLTLVLLGSFVLNSKKEIKLSK